MRYSWLHGHHMEYTEYGIATIKLMRLEGPYQYESSAVITEALYKYIFGCCKARDVPCVKLFTYQTVSRMYFLQQMSYRASQ